MIPVVARTFLTKWNFPLFFRHDSRDNRFGFFGMDSALFRSAQARRGAGTNRNGAHGKLFPNGRFLLEKRISLKKVSDR